MKKIFGLVLALFVTFGLWANPLTKVSKNEWIKTEEVGERTRFQKNDVVMTVVSTIDTHYITLKDNEMFIVFEGDFKETKAVEFDLLHNRVPDVEWKEIKDGQATKRKLVKKTITNASETKEDFEWSEE